eukprot:TRINITY_DN63634_c0_g2_i1.p1 TRINITY_DN63634_c0_g2~~TRINITY_DN63634_c0_g2_i1.p1  ORF type:complete len:249 (+),score=45.64 TRINITY_DN63634_c0_g2_i1:113-859(+)
MPSKRNSNTSTSERGERGSVAEGKKSTADDKMRDSDNKSEEGVVCTACTESFSDPSKLVQCDRCDGYTCQSCSGMSKEQWRCNVTSNPKGKGPRKMSFFCDSCQPHALREVKMGNLIDEKCKTMQEQIDVFKQEVSDRLDNELGKVRKDMEEMKNQMTGHDKAVEDRISERVNEKMSDCGRLSVLELQEREDRKANLILINIPESEKDTATERIDDDIKSIEAILSELKEVASFKKPMCVSVCVCVCE